MGSPLVRAAFAALVGATIAVFFVTQQLKGEFPLVLRFAVAPKAISPNGDGVRDGAIVGFDLSEPATVSFSVVDSEGSDVRRLVDDRRLAGDTKHRFFWNGRDDAGRRVPDGIYRLRLVRRDEGRVINSFKELRVDTRPPRVELSSARPGVIAPGDPGRHPRVAIRYRGLRNGAPEFRIFRTDDGSPRVVARFRGNDKRMGLWRGHIRGHPAVDGDYAFTVTIRDGAGNRGVAPAEIPTAELALPGTGVSVRHLTLLGPVGVLRAGSPAVLEVGPYPRGFEFALSRLGSKRIVKRGSRFGGRFRVRVPPRARTGVYLLRVRARRRRAVWPLAVEGRPQARGPRPLVVLPVVSWEGLNRFDDDLDGFAETLQDSRSVRLERPFARGRPPPLYDSQATPLLRFLDREKLPFDLTTDVSLDRGEHPSLARAPGAALAGSARWLTPTSLRGLQRYVKDGGRLASFGADALRRSVRLNAGVLRDPTAARPENALGERTRLLRASPAPLAVERDRIGLFDERFVGEFSIFERSMALPPGARRLAAAGRDPGQPAFVVYRLGRGLVLRVGTPQWSAALPEGAVAGVTRHIWSLLQRG
ncbi:MAG TPA: N,N-dimethylformamidase beta subunit family domain-containing protein [Thermoleophilaceae bacterium]|nr:N,N-dimethylformamidase beta subunit family domain-containing protein [Thermoleophilaceae bacterium]